LLGCALALLVCLEHGLPTARLARPAASAFALLVLGVISANHRYHFTHARELRAVLTFDDHVDDDARVARWSRAHTPVDAVFVIPPGLGSFRLIAERAVVVDYKSLPFGASAMRTWYQRMLALYGPVSAGGFPGLRQMEENYARLSDPEIARLNARFGAAYAVLYARTPTTRAALYRNATFQIVQL
jgi:hypothetical protein